MQRFVVSQPSRIKFGSLLRKLNISCDPNLEALKEKKKMNFDGFLIIIEGLKQYSDKIMIVALTYSA